MRFLDRNIYNMNNTSHFHCRFIIMDLCIDVFTVRDLSVFQITNNDVEGYHYRINAKAHKCKYTFINYMNIESICIYIYIYIYDLFIFQLLWNFSYYAIYLKQKLIK